MRINNEEIAEILLQIADALEEHEDNPYRIRAYRKAAYSIKKYSEQIEMLIKDGIDLTVIPHVGTKLAEKIKKIILEPNNFLPKFNPAESYPIELKLKKRKPYFFKIYNVMKVIDKIFKQLTALKEVKKISESGDLRRRREIMHEVDIIVLTDHPAAVLAYFHSLLLIEYIIETSSNKSLVQLRSGLRVTLHTTKNEHAFACKLLKTTGSTLHYKKIQSIAKKNHVKISVNGLYHEHHQLLIKSEEEIYHTLKLAFIPPELRENRGEFVCALNNTLPKLVSLTDIKGDLHCHTTETDGTFTLEEMVNAAYEHGYQYVAITDHSQSLKITNGMDATRLLKQIEQINKLNRLFPNFVILKSMEVDILEDGSLDMPNAVLKELDLTVCSVHSKFNLPLQKQTERIIRAMDNPYFTILGHATGRLMHRRPPYQIDIDLILQAAKDRNCFIEVNAQPARLDINDYYCFLAKQKGVKVAISSDAHSLQGFHYMNLGVNQARRGWLEAKDVINTYDYPALLKLIKQRKA